MQSSSLPWLARSALLCLLVGTCIAQFQQRQQYNSFSQQPQQQQQSFDSYTHYHNQQQRERALFHQQQSQRSNSGSNAFAQQNQFAQPQQQQQRNLGSQGGLCPEANGRFPVGNQCDAYIECIDGVPEQKLCPEGLLFNPEARFNYPCGYPIDIKCLSRTNLQPAQPTEDCPHQYGYFKMGDRQSCGQFMNCVEGRAYVFNCPEGLAYNPETYRCDWPDQVSDCDAEAFLGFTCPTVNQNAFLSSEVKFYRSPNDCQHYYICVNDRPRLQNCGEGHAFNELIGTCDAAENVTGCEPPRSLNENFQPIQLDQPQQNVRSFNQQSNFNQQRNTFNQPQSFGSFNTQQTRNQQDSRRTQQNNNQFARQRFTSTF